MCELNKQYSSRIKKLRILMNKSKIDALYLPHEDEHLTEYIPRNKERLKWALGFSGSAGSSIITKNEIYLFVDGRYLLQAKNETKKLKCIIYDVSKVSFLDFIEKNVKNYKSLGLDPKLISYSNYIKILTRLKKNKMKIIFTEKNLIDSIWKRTLNSNQQNKIFFLPNKYTGLDKEKKITLVKKFLCKEKSDFIFMQNSESVAWLLNLRGCDLPYTPLTYCYALLSANKVDLFFENTNIKSALLSNFSNKCSINKISDFDKVLSAYKKDKKIILDGGQTSLYFFNLIKKKSAIIIFKNDPVTELKAIKNTTEINGMKQAHLLDSIALCKFLYWFKSKKGIIKELDIIKKIDNLRKKNRDFISLSFPTIAGSGSNGSIIHYQADKLTNRTLKNDDILLLDSGGQYTYGTTDVTRTINRGKPNKEHILDYTLVLKGHIAINLAKFPVGTKCAYLDYLARQFLWQNNKDFPHSTGHGVGFCLNVHEGPFSISQNSNSPLTKGMVFSNEPGYYLNNKYGIRIENLVTTKVENKNKSIIRIKSLTMAPYEIELIKYSILSTIEKNWLNNYHKNLFNKVSPFLTLSEKNWLSTICKEVK